MVDVFYYKPHSHGVKTSTKIQSTIRILKYMFVSSMKLKVVDLAEKSNKSAAGRKFEDPCNNWPISLLSILSKVSERLVNHQFVDYITTTKKLSKFQSGN